MKKIAIAGLVAVALLAISQHQASAWTNTKFGIGLNFEHQAGGNSFLWGLYRNGQPPGDAVAPAGPAYPFHGPRMMVPQGAIIAPPQANTNGPSFVPAPVGFPVQGAVAPAAAFPMGYANPYQFASYPRPVYYYYYSPYYGQ